MSFTTVASNITFGVKLDANVSAAGLALNSKSTVNSFICFSLFALSSCLIFALFAWRMELSRINESPGRNPEPCSGIQSVLLSSSFFLALLWWLLYLFSFCYLHHHYLNLCEIVCMIHLQRSTYFTAWLPWLTGCTKVPYAPLKWTVGGSLGYLSLNFALNIILCFFYLLFLVTLGSDRLGEPSLARSLSAPSCTWRTSRMERLVLWYQLFSQLPYTCFSVPCSSVTFGQTAVSWTTPGQGLDITALYKPASSHGEGWSSSSPPGSVCGTESQWIRLLDQSSHPQAPASPWGQGLPWPGKGWELVLCVTLGRSIILARSFFGLPSSLLWLVALESARVYSCSELLGLAEL